MNEEELIGFRKKMRRLERSVADLFGGEPLCCGISMAQCHTLLAVEEKGETSVTDLAVELDLDKSTLSRTIDSLVRAGLVGRETKADNRRAQRLYLTAKGQNTAGSINRQWNEYYQAMFARIPKTKHGQILESISYVIDAIKANRAPASRRKPKEKSQGMKQ